ncbi:MAG: ABC transporter permease [Ruminococcaceae bacterium]|nr:ABC transporter permease [Oscillospiraceae bacterium]
MTRDLTVKKKFDLSKFLVSWEMILVYILIFINIILMLTKPNLYFSSGTITSIIQSGMDLSFMVLGMIFILMIGDIDVSTASTMIACAMTTGLIFQSGAGAFFAILGGLLTGILCGAINGTLVALCKMPSVIVTIATSLVFRGIVRIILDVNVLKSYPSWLSKLSWGNIFGIPFSLIIFILASIGFAICLHKSRFGRKLYMIGNSTEVSRYSGIRVKTIKIIVFIIMGIMAFVSSLFFIGRMGSISSDMGIGYELNVIAIAVLGGISTNGGKGRVYGCIISTLIIAFLNYSLGLLGIESNTRTIVVGLILIIAVLISNIKLKASKA